ncbi:TonB-dependent receptor [Novosphingobium sp. FSY-8]|uniref:TonB-dependent receptor n=2 Tax=Novosphingobium ovatum TaxID=1908523 RepID=A0ABW9XGZ6_9SPHN|nr:TonB-dependent receptor [Novosphingobium ovatum]
MVAGLLAPVAARADDAAPDSAAQIVVTGLESALRLNATYDTRVLGRDALVASASGRVEDVLSNVAGFQQFRRSDSRAANPSSQGVTLRALGGNAAARTLVLLDGVPMADPMFGSVPLSAIAPDRLGAIRVTRGGGSGAFGAGAVAGTIEMESAPARVLHRLSAEAMGNDRGETSLSGGIAAPLGGGELTASARWDRGDGFWTTPVSQRAAASVPARYDGWSGALRAVVPIAADVELQARVMAFGDHRTLRFAGANSISRGEDASIRVIGRGRWGFDLLAYVQDRGFSNITISSGTYRPTVDQRSTPSTGIGAKAEVRPPLGGDHLLRLGADWRHAQGDLSEVGYNASTGAVTAYRTAGGRSGDLGLYAEEAWTPAFLNGAVTLTGAVRADRWSISGGYNTTASPAGVVTVALNHPDRADWAVTGRGGLRWQVTGRLAVIASAYTGLRQPTVNELYRSFTLTASGVSTVTNANPALGNELLRGAEAGVEWRPAEALRLSVTAFDNRVAHAIANVTTAQTLTTITRLRQNVDAIRARGLEIEAGVKAGKVTLDGSLALSDAVVRASGAAVGLNGMRPAQTPKVAASLTLGWQPREGLRGAVILRHVGSQYEDDQQVSLMPSATTIGAYVQVPVRAGVSLILRGENLADVAVITRSQPVPGQPNSIDLAAPRTVWAGVRIGL